MTIPPDGQSPPNGDESEPQQPYGQNPPQQPFGQNPPQPPPYYPGQPYGQPYNGQSYNGQWPNYGQPPHGQQPYGQPPYGQPQYGQPPYGQPPYNQAPYGQQPYGQQPYGGYPGMPPYGSRPALSFGAKLGIGTAIGLGASAISFLLMIAVVGFNMSPLVWLASLSSLLVGIGLLFSPKTRGFGTGILITAGVIWLVLLGPCAALFSAF